MFITSRIDKLEARQTRIFDLTAEIATLTFTYLLLLCPP